MRRGARGGSGLSQLWDWLMVGVPVVLLIVGGVWATLQFMQPASWGALVA